MNLPVSEKSFDTTMEPRRSAEGLVKLVHYIENLDITILWKNNENIRYIEG